MKWYYNMKIGTKLITGFILVALIAGIIGVVGFMSLNEVGEVRLPSIKGLLEIELGMTDVMLGERGLVNRRMMDRQVRQAQYSTVQHGLDYIRVGWELYEPLPQTRDEALLWSSFLTIFQEWERAHKDVYEMSLEKDRLLASGVSIDSKTILDLDQRIFDEHIQATITFENAQKAMEEIIDLNSKIAHDEIRKADAMIIIFTIFGVIISILLGLFISNIIRKPINKMVDVAQKIADGDLDVTIDIDTKDEVGILAQAFKRMADNINDVMSNINAASEQVASGSKQVSDSSMALSQGATEQASSIEQLTASLEEISSQTRQNAENANQANTLAGSAKDNAAKGNTQMKEMLKAMDEINDSSSNISKIIKVIDEIAFQTNILALNAAVEAARAGQHGKGFAVVAEEVRNLAARSANAAKETTVMIEGSIKKVEGGTKIANETAGALSMIVEGVAKVANLVSDIAVASNEQASGIAQVNQGVMQVSEVVQTNSATSEESAAASEELASQAELLKEQVKRFKLKKAVRSISSYRGMDHIDPDILRMLESMAHHKKGDKNNQDHAYDEAAVTSSKKIALSDKEFGKY